MTETASSANRTDGSKMSAVPQSIESMAESSQTYHFKRRPSKRALRGDGIIDTELVRTAA